MERYSIYVTKKCNCKCLYCYDEDKETTYTWPEIKEHIDNNTKEGETYIIEFLGGEPLLAFELVKKSIEYLRTKKINIQDIWITTNGTILNNEMIQFFVKNEDIYIGISLDGTKSMNQLRLLENDKNTHDLVIRNFHKLKEKISIDRIMFHMVLHSYNIHSLEKGVSYLYDQGVRFIDIGIIEKTMKLDNSFYEEFVKQHVNISKLMAKGKCSDLKLTTIYFEPFPTNKNYVWHEGKVIGEKCIIGDINNERYNLLKIVYENHKKIIRGENTDVI